MIMDWLSAAEDKVLDGDAGRWGFRLHWNIGSKDASSSDTASNVIAACRHNLILPWHDVIVTTDAL